MNDQPPPTGPAAPSPDPAPAWQLLRLLDGFVTTQLLYVAAKLGIAGVLADGPRSGDEVAEAVGVDPTPSPACCGVSRWRTCWSRPTTVALP
jgi:hypothetical protein